MDNILKTTELYYGIQNLQIDKESQESLQDFLHNPNVLLLQGVLDNKNNLKYCLEVELNEKESIFFYKSSSNALADNEAFNSFNIITLSNTPAESLCVILKQVYTPLLIKGNDLVHNKIQQNLSDLESNLRILTHGKSGTVNYQVIFTIEDEIGYWKSILQNKKATRKDVEAATAFSALFEEINDELRLLQTSSLPEIKEISENINGLLDDIWRHNISTYPQDRMKHIFDVIGHVINLKVQSILDNLEMWTAHENARDNEILCDLSDSFKAIQAWTSGCQSLTETYWPNHALHPWDGKPYVPTFSLFFLNKIKDVLYVKSTHHQLIKLLTKSEKMELNTDKLFEPFRDLNNIWSNGSKSAWECAVSNFENKLRPTESKIAEKLKPRLHNLSTKQMLYEFIRYKMLIQRPHVKEALYNELEIFLSSLGSMLKSIQSQVDSGEADASMMYRPPETSLIIHQVQWAKQMEAKVKDIRDCTESYLREFQASAELINLSNQVCRELKNMYTQLHDEWCRNLQAQVKDGSLRLGLDKPVVEFSASNKMMVVHFNPRAVSVELEVRGMTALGLPPPAAVKEAVDNLARFLHHARTLQQVASFHNTLGERMIPSTRPMMLQAALELSSLVQEQRAVYWDNVEQVANYAEMLKKAVLNLERQNSYLTSEHVAIRKIVESLMDTDLLAKQSEWKKKIKDMREIIEKVEVGGYKNTELWRSHWDWQLYKALECQYIKTLLSLHKHFPHVKVDLVLRGREVRLQPPMEEIRVQHYHQLRRLISIPTQFVGVQDNVKTTESIFSSIVDKHSWMGNKSVRQIEATLEAVEKTCVEWTRRTALACVGDLEALCRSNLREPAHWELNFKACKAYGQAVAKMSFDDEKVDWISIGTATLRREFEAQVRNLWSCLISSLQASCREDTVQLDAFIANATLTLENKMLPKNAKELSEISSKQHALQEKMPEMEKIVEALKKKGHMLQTWGGDPSIQNTIKEWQKIHELILSQQQMFLHQAEIVKTGLNGEWDNLNSSLEVWVSRWMQTKSRFEETHDITFTDMCDRCERVFEAQAQWEKYIFDKDELLKECIKFGMNVKESDSWKQAETTVATDRKLWAIFKEYKDEFESLAEQDWIVFNKKLHLIDEFVSNWSGRLEPYTPITLFIQQELDKYSDLTSLLKYLRGTDYTDYHWREIFSFLGMEYKKPDTLKVSDFLCVAGNIKKQIKNLQKISVTATSEAAIRGALTELELWFAGARFTLTYYKDKAGHSTPIVKDFKEILSKIEEQQWIVSSVRGGDGGSDACATWESRLRQAHALARDTHHAQRSVRHNVRMVISGCAIVIRRTEGQNELCLNLNDPVSADFTSH